MVDIKIKGCINAWNEGHVVRVASMNASPTLTRWVMLESWSWRHHTLGMIFGYDLGLLWVKSLLPINVPAIDTHIIRKEKICYKKTASIALLLKP